MISLAQIATLSAIFDTMDINISNDVYDQRSDITALSTDIHNYGLDLFNSKMFSTRPPVYEYSISRGTQDFVYEAEYNDFYIEFICNVNLKIRLLRIFMKRKIIIR